MVLKLGYIFNTLVLFVLTNFFISCSEQNIQKGDLYDFVTIYKNNNSDVEYFQLDNKLNLNIVENLSQYTPKNIRAFISYKLLDDNNISSFKNIILNGYIYDIPTKDIKFISSKNKHLQDSIGYAGVNILAAQALNNYITIRYNYLTDGGNQLTSLISLKEYSEDITPDTLYLQFRQNSLNSKLNYKSLDKYICFDIKSFFAENQISDSLVIKLNWISTKGENKTQIIEYKN